MRKLSPFALLLVFFACAVHGQWAQISSQSESSPVRGLEHRYIVVEDPEYRPIGLLIVDGTMIAPLQKARLLSGVLSASPKKVQISRVAEFSLSQKPDTAVESGPMIVDLSKSVRGLESTKAARRTFAALGAGDKAALGFCSDVTLADLSNILAMVAIPDFKIQRALNLDGGSSSAFWFKRANGSAFSIAEQKPVRDFVAVVAK